MEKEIIIKLSYKEEVLCFLITKDTAFEEEEIKDIVEDAIIKAKSEDNYQLKSIGDSVYYELSDNGFIVSDFPYDAKICSFDVESVYVHDIEYDLT